MIVLSLKFVFFTSLSLQIIVLQNNERENQRTVILIGPLLDLHQKFILLIMLWK